MRSGDLDILGNYWEGYTHACRNVGKLERNLSEVKNSTYLDVNHHSVDRTYTGEVLNFFNELIAEMKGKDFFDETDIMTDYFHCSHYLNIEVGHYTNEKPYIYNGELAKLA